MSNSRTPRHEGLDEGLRYERAGLLEKALAQYRDVRAATTEGSVVAESWTLEAFVHHARGDWEAALMAAERGLALALEHQRPDLAADALNARATVHYGRGDFEAARRVFDEMLAVAPDDRSRGLALQNLGSLAGQLGDFTTSEARFAEAERCFESAGYDWGRAHIHNNRAALALERQDYRTAESASRSAVMVARRVDDLDLLAIATMNLAEALAGNGELDEAEAEVSRALGQFEVSGNAWRRIACFRILGDVNLRQGDRAVAERMWRRGLELARELGATADATQLAARLSAADGRTGAEEEAS